MVGGRNSDRFFGFVADLEALDKDLDDLRSKIQNVSPDAIARRLEAVMHFEP